MRTFDKKGKDIRKITQICHSMLNIFQNLYNFQNIMKQISNKSVSELCTPLKFMYFQHNMNREGYKNQWKNIHLLLGSYFRRFLKNFVSYFNNTGNGELVTNQVTYFDSVH